MHATPKNNMVCDFVSPIKMGFGVWVVFRFCSHFPAFTHGANTCRPTGSKHKHEKINNRHKATHFNFSKKITKR